MSQKNDVHDLIPTDHATLAADQHPVAAYLATLSATSRRTVVSGLKTALSILSANDDADLWSAPWHLLRYPHVDLLRVELTSRRYAPATANRILSSVKQVVHHAWKLGLLSADEWRKIQDVRSVSGRSLPAGRALSKADLAALLEACQAGKQPAGKRDAAIIAVLYATGIRRSSLVALAVTDYHPDTGELIVRSAKGNKAYITFVAAGHAPGFLAQWLVVRGDTPGPLFTPINKAGRLSMRQMTPEAIYHILARRAKEAGLDHLTPHDLRRTFVSDLLDAGVDLSIVQGLANHANVTTTARYDRRPAAARRRAASLISLPNVQQIREA